MLLFYEDEIYFLKHIEGIEKSWLSIKLYFTSGAVSTLTYSDEQTLNEVFDKLKLVLLNKDHSNGHMYL